MFYSDNDIVAIALLFSRSHQVVTVRLQWGIIREWIERPRNG